MTAPQEGDTMSPAKAVTLEAVASLPETCTMDEVLDKVNLVTQVLEGLEDAEAGRTITTDQLLAKVDAWGM
jgi:predicted transcriptional regulator